MSDEQEKSNQEDKMPEFKPQYFWAFCALMLYKLGDVEAISLECLDKFNAERDSPDVIWNAEKKAFIMKNKEISRPSPIAIPGKIRKKMIRNILKGRN